MMNQYFSHSEFHHESKAQGGNRNNFQLETLKNVMNLKTLETFEKSLSAFDEIKTQIKNEQCHLHLGFLLSSAEISIQMAVERNKNFLIKFTVFARLKQFTHFYRNNFFTYCRFIFSPRLQEAVKNKLDEREKASSNLSLCRSGEISTKCWKQVNFSLMLPQKCKHLNWMT